jgi:hypothetical protein
MSLALLFVPPAVAADPEEAAEPTQSPPKLNIPIPIGHEAKKIRIPYFSLNGKLQMNFTIAVARRVDNETLQMESVNLETYDEDGTPGLMLDMPFSELNLNTKVITSNKPVTIRRSDFELSGESLEFNTATRNGVLRGKVRMLIYNAGQILGSGS